MITKFSELLGTSPGFRPRVAVAVAHEKHVIESASTAQEKGLVQAVLIGDKQWITEWCGEKREDSCHFEIIHCKGDEQGVQVAVDLVREGKAQMLMKGNINSARFLKVVMDKNRGLTLKRYLSFASLLELPHLGKTLLVTDGTIAIEPNLKEKKAILENAIDLARQALGWKHPLVGAIAASEEIREEMKSTIEAAILSRMAQTGQISDAIVEGPMALDVALSEESAKTKCVIGAVPGKAQILLFDNLEAANAFVKSCVHVAGASTAGIVLGAECPIVLTSRGDSVESKLYSIALSRQYILGTQVGQV